MSTKNAYDIVLLPGDGIGLEIAIEARKVLDTVSPRIDVSFNIEEIPCGGEYYLEHGRDWPAGSEEKCAAADVMLLGAVGWPDPNGVGPVTMANGKMAGYSPVIGNRTRFNLYANVRKVKLLPGVRHRISGSHQQVWSDKNVDMVFVRENTEGLYAGMGGTLSPGGKGLLATDTRVITRVATERVVRKAFALCNERGRGAPKDGKKRVTCIVKDNVLQGCKLFAQIFTEIGEEFPDIEKDFAIVDAFTQWLITQPEYYDVCVTSNMFGDIVTDLASVLQGGMGMAVGCNVGDDHAMFEPIHGSAPKHAGKNIACPLGAINAVAMMLEYLGEMTAAQRIDDAVGDLLRSGQVKSADARSGISTSAMGDMVVSRIRGA